MFDKWLEDPSTITGAGSLALIVVALMTEKLVPGVVHRREIARNDKLEAENDRLNEKIYQLLGMAGKAVDLADRATGRA